MPKPPYKDGHDELDRIDLDRTIEISQSTITRLDELTDEKERPSLIAIAGPVMGRMFRLGKQVTVMGRAADVDIVLNDDGISRRHAQICKQGAKYIVIDLDSTNGIYVNGDKVDRRVLQDGDRIRIGSSSVLKFSLQDEVEEEFQKQMYDSAVRDGLTEIYNKRYFRDSLTTEFAYYSRHNLVLSVIMLDIDHFKKVNDTYGHIAGDYVLKIVAKLIGQSLRTEDILCRYGGEEFGILLRSTGAEEALLVAERVRKAIEAYDFYHDDKHILLTISLGISTLQEGNFPSAIHLVRAADKYLYAAKEAGRNRTVCARPRKDRLKAKTRRIS